MPLPQGDFSHPQVQASLRKAQVVVQCFHIWREPSKTLLLVLGMHIAHALILESGRWLMTFHIYKVQEYPIQESGDNYLLLLLAYMKINV